MLIDLRGSFRDVSAAFRGPPMTVIVELRLEFQHHRLTLTRSTRVESFLAFFRDCWQDRVTDLNREQGALLEFGRYLVEFWNEDHPIDETIADTVRIEAAFLPASSSGEVQGRMADGAETSPPVCGLAGFPCLRVV